MRAAQREPRGTAHKLARTAVLSMIVLFSALVESLRTPVLEALGVALAWLRSTSLLLARAVLVPWCTTLFWSVQVVSDE